VTFRSRHPSHANWQLTLPPSRCPLDGNCLAKVRPPRNGEKCECGEQAVVVVVDHFGVRMGICWASWTKP
jgi:hypothetical protein